MNIRIYTGGMAQTNAYLIGENDNCILIDAPLGVAAWLESENARPSELLLTHQHYDHVEGAAELAQSGVRISAYAPYAIELTLETLLQQSGINLRVNPYQVDEILKDQNTLKLNGFDIQLAHTPGHAPDSLIFKINDCVFAGDTLFAGGVGRPDLPGGDMQVLLNSIQTELLSLDDSTRVLPGHGPETTIATEKASNPYL